MPGENEKKTPQISKMLDVYYIPKSLLNASLQSGYVLWPKAAPRLEGFCGTDYSAMVKTTKL